jgi:hypothetical protein
MVDGSNHAADRDQWDRSSIRSLAWSAIPSSCLPPARANGTFFTPALPRGCVAGDDEALAQDLLLEPTIDKVFASGALSTEFDPREPHEGFLLDFLFQRKAVRSGPGSAERLLHA